MPPALRFAAPTSLPQALALSFQHKRGVRWFYGTSELLAFEAGLVPADAPFIIDARGIPELSAIDVGPSIRIGAFVPKAALARDAALAEIPALREVTWSLAQLCALDARVVIVSEGQYREIEMIKLCGGTLPPSLPPHEFPLQIVFPRPGQHAALIERRRATNDGPASFDQRVAVSMALAAGGRTAHVRIIAHLVDVALMRVRPAEAKLQHVKPTRVIRSAAAHEAAKLFEAVDSKTSAALRALPPMILSALNDALRGAQL